MSYWQLTGRQTTNSRQRIEEEEEAFEPALEEVEVNQPDQEAVDPVIDDSASDTSSETSSSSSSTTDTMGREDSTKKEERNKIPILKDENFPTWKIRMTSALKAKGVWKVVDEGFDEETDAKGSYKNDKAVALMLDNLSDAHVGKFGIHESAKEMWDAIITHMTNRTPLAISVLNTQFTGAAKLRNETYEEYMERVETIARKLNDLKPGMKDNDEIIVQVLQGLPKSLMTFTAGIYATSSEIRTIEYVSEQMRALDMLDKGKGPAQNDSALLGEARGGRQCFYCKKEGHLKRDCRKLAADKAKRSKSSPNSSQTNTNQGSGGSGGSNGSGGSGGASAGGVSQKPGALMMAEVVGFASPSSEWYVDSGATQHICNCQYDFDDGSLRVLSPPVAVRIGDGTVVTATKSGSVTLQVSVGEESYRSLTLRNVLHLEGFAKNLVSVPRITSLGYSVSFKGDECVVEGDQYGDDAVFVADRLPGSQLYMMRLYQSGLGDTFLAEEPIVDSDAESFIEGGMEENDVPPLIESAHVAEGPSQRMALYHRRFGHTGAQRVRQASRHVKGMPELGSNDLLDFCDVCHLARSDRLPMGGTRPRATRRFGRMHIDLCGPFRSASRTGSFYFILFTDDLESWRDVEGMRFKSETTEEYQALVKRIQAEFPGATIASIRVDGGTEFLPLKDFLAQQGTVMEIIEPDTPQRNGVAERSNRTTVNMARSMLFEANLPAYFWLDAIKAAVYILNRTPTRSLSNGITPFEARYGRQPDVSHLRVFGCDAYVRFNDSVQRKQGKLAPKAERLVFIGYDDLVNSWVFCDPQQPKRIVRSRDAHFVEWQFTRQHNHTAASPFDDLEDAWNPVPSLPSFGQLTDMRQVHRPVYNALLASEQREYLSFVDDFEEELALAVDISQMFGPDPADPDPLTYKEAMARPDAAHWTAAIADELVSLVKLRTFEQVAIPPGVKLVGAKLVFRRKWLPSRLLDKYKARVVVQGFSQVYGVHYTETFSPVVTFVTVRVLMAVATHRGWVIRHGDYSTAFMNSKLDDSEAPIYIRIPEGMRTPENEGMCWLLMSAIPGLKQGSRSWNKSIDKEYRSKGFVPVPSDPCVYTQAECDESDRVYIALFVDDALLIGPAEAVDAAMKLLGERYKINDLGEVTQYLGVDITRRDGKTYLGQRKYLQAIVKRFGMENAKPTSTPMEDGGLHPTRTPLEEDDKSFPYREAVGSLMYAMLATRPDLAFAIKEVSRHASDPCKEDIQNVKRILRYVAGTLDMGIVYDNHGGVLNGYSDANWGGDSETRRSTTGNVFFVGNSVVSWKSKLQPTVALSSMEAEYQAFCAASQEAIWIRQLLSDLSLQHSDPIDIKEDNQACIAHIHNPTERGRTKHFDIRLMFVRELVLELKTVKPVYCPTELMVADIFTKALGRPLFERHRSSLGLTRLSA